MSYLSSMLIILSLLLWSCQSSVKTDSASSLDDQGLRICQDLLMLDSHIDWPERNYHFPLDISSENPERDFDLIRAKKGGLNAAWSVLYVPPELGIKEGRMMVDSLFTIIEEYPLKYPGEFALARTPNEIMKNFKDGLFSLPMSLENGDPIGNELSYIRKLTERGISYITLCHSKSNQICDSNYDADRPWKGISPFGQEVIREMNRQGIMIDISHSTDSTVFQVFRTSRAPIVAHIPLAGNLHQALKGTYPIP